MLREIAVVQETVNDAMFRSLLAGATRGQFYKFDDRKKPYLVVGFNNRKNRIVADLGRGLDNFFAQVEGLYKSGLVDDVFAWDPVNDPLGKSVLYLPRFFFEGMVGLNDLEVWHVSYFATRVDAVDEMAKVLCEYEKAKNLPNGPCWWLESEDETLKKFKESSKTRRGSITYALVEVGRMLVNYYIRF